MLDASNDWTSQVPPYGDNEQPTAAPSAGAESLPPLPEPVAARPPLLRHVRELLTNPPAVRWLVRDILEADTLAMIYGQPGAGKSFLALDLAASIACGVPWFGQRTRQGAAVYILGEGGAGVSRRLRAWQLSHPEAHLEAAPLFVSRRMVPLGESEAVAEIEAAIEEANVGQPSIVWIDTLARAAAGLDENSARDMGELVKACDAIRERHGCAVVLVHHAGHGQDRARGSSAIKAALDTEISASKDGEVITVQSTKSKEGEPFKPFYFRLQSVDTRWLDEDKERTYSAVLEATDAPEQPNKATKGLGDNQKLALAVLRRLYAEHRARLAEGGLEAGAALVAVKDWRAACRDEELGKDAFRRAVEGLEGRNLVNSDGIHAILSEDLTAGLTVQKGGKGDKGDVCAERAEDKKGDVSDSASIEARRARRIPRQTLSQSADDDSGAVASVPAGEEKGNYEEF